MEGRQALADLRSADESVRHRATLALGGSKPRDAEWVPDLINGVRDGAAGVRFWAATALGGIGRAAVAAVPALVEMLASDERFGNRQVAAHALAKVGRAAPSEAVPAFARALESDESEFVRQDVVRALGELGVFDGGAVIVLVSALDHRDEAVRQGAVSALASLGERAADAVPTLRMVADREGEVPSVQADAARAADRIESGAPVLRYDEPHQSITQAIERGRFIDPDVRVRALDARDREDFAEAVALLEAGAAPEQESMFWLDLFTAAREIDLPEADRFYDRWARAEGGFSVGDEVRSARSVQEGIQRLLDHLADQEPDPRWDALREVAVEEDLERLQAWLEAVFSLEPPPDDIAGLYFAITDLLRDGRRTIDLSISGERAERELGDRVIGGSWTPRAAFAKSCVLDQISDIARSGGRPPPAGAPTTVALAYSALAVRHLLTKRPDLVLGGAKRRVIDVGFDDGDWIAIGTLTPNGLTPAQE